jgi:CheY-like chemotaxis protein
MSEKLEGIRIFFIDDDYVNYLFFSEMLSDTGVIFYRAFTLTKTLEVLQEESCISLIVVSSAISRKPI